MDNKKRNREIFTLHECGQTCTSLSIQFGLSPARIFRLFILFVLHTIGDYVLQIDYIANTKDKNIYHMVVHCALYTAPFIFVFGMEWRIIVLFITHFIIDTLKVKKRIKYFDDQVFHLFVPSFLYWI